MKGCIIHIGMHKTGSTSIQISLNNFKNDKFYYANLGSANHSIPIYCLFSKTPEQHHVLRGLRREQIEKRRIDIRKRLIKSIEDAGDRLLIISGEDISLLSEIDLKKLKNFLETKINHNIKIIGYVRNPYEYTNSAFQQILKARFINLDELNKIYPNYRNRFKKFFKVFGEENILLKKFDPDRFPNNDVVLDFCQTFGIEIPKDMIKRVNESFPKEIVGLFYIFRKYKDNISLKPPQIQFLGEFLKNLFHDLKLTKFRIDPELIKPIIDKNLDDIKWIEEKIGEPLINVIKFGGGIKSEEELMQVREDLLDRLLKEVKYSFNKNYQANEIADILNKIFRQVIKDNRLVSKIIRVEKDRIFGWAFMKDSEKPVLVKFYINEKLEDEDLAIRLRQGLKVKNIHPTGKCGFLLKSSIPLNAANLIEVEYILGKENIKKEAITVDSNRKSN